MEGGGFGFPFGGDPEELLRGIQEFAAQQAESVQEAQREQFATLTLNTAVELTAAALKQVQPAGVARPQTSARDGGEQRDDGAIEQGHGAGAYLAAQVGGSAGPDPPTRNTPDGIRFAAARGVSARA